MPFFIYLDTRSSEFTTTQHQSGRWLRLYSVRCGWKMLLCSHPFLTASRVDDPRGLPTPRPLITTPALQRVQEAFQISCSYEVLMAQAQTESRKYELGQELAAKEKAQSYRRHPHCRPTQPPRLQKVSSPLPSVLSLLPRSNPLQCIVSWCTVIIYELATK